MKGLSKGRYDETFTGEDGYLAGHMYHLTASTAKLCQGLEGSVC